MNNKRVGIVITDGVGFRNYILSDFLKEAEATYKEVIIYSFLPKSAYKGFISSAQVIELEDIQDGFFTWFFMKLKEVAHMQLNRKGNFGIQFNYNRNKAKGSTNRDHAKRFIYAFTQLFHSERWISFFNKCQQITFKNHKITKQYFELLKSHNVDFLFFTHQRPPYIAPLVYAANKLGIKVCTFIFSWDNLACKGRMAATFDNYFVWSELMKSELLDFYSKIKSKQIFVVGTPQFEPYVLERYGLEESDFKTKFTLDKNEKTICYSCGDVTTSQNDGLYVETIAEAIANGEIPKNTNFLVRTSPAETAERFIYLKDKYRFIIWNYPKSPLSREGHQETWSQRIPAVEDMSDLKSILKYCDVFVNMCSTMSLDAMCFDRPVINPVFGNKENGLYDDQRFLNYLHYKRVAESGAVAIVKNKEELISGILEAIDNPKLRLEAQKNLLKTQVSHKLEGTSKRIVNTINQCIS
jgi:hypothetical protein